ncbi:hypothetical protein COOONC_13030, partial [Cooperia oncophora]
LFNKFLFSIKKELGSCYRVNRKASELFKVRRTQREQFSCNYSFSGLHGRELLFRKAEAEPTIHHPLSVFNIQLWPAAKMRRIRPEFFRQDGRDLWVFDMAAARNGLNDDLSVLYETVVKTPYLSHFTQDDAEALMQVCSSNCFERKKFWKNSSFAAGFKATKNTIRVRCLWTGISTLY